MSNKSDPISAIRIMDMPSVYLNQGPSDLYAKMIMHGGKATLPRHINETVRSNFDTMPLNPNATGSFPLNYQEKNLKARLDKLKVWGTVSDSAMLKTVIRRRKSGSMMRKTPD